VGRRGGGGGDDSGWYGWNGWDWGWGDPSLLTPNLTGGNGGWWIAASVQSPTSSTYIGTLTSSTGGGYVGSIENDEPVMGHDIHSLGICFAHCGEVSNAGETYEMRSQRYLTNFMQTIVSVASMFNGAQFEAAIEIKTPFNFNNLKGAAIEWQEVERVPEQSWALDHAGVYKSPAAGPNGKPLLLANGDPSFSLYYEDLDGMGLTRVSNHYGFLSPDNTFASSISNFSLRGLNGELIVAPNEFKIFPLNEMQISHAYFNDMKEWGAIKFKF
jgi:hypothetical protein